MIINVPADTGRGYISMEKKVVSSVSVPSLLVLKILFPQVTRDFLIVLHKKSYILANATLLSHISLTIYKSNLPY